MSERQSPLEGMEKRDIFEMQDTVVLLGYKALLLSKMSDLETDVHLINDVLGGSGYSEAVR
jgi:hypothetical protein